MTKRELVIFDFDGTLVDTTLSYYEAAKYASKVVLNKSISKENALKYAYILELTNNPLKALSGIFKSANNSKSDEFLQKWAEAFNGPTKRFLRPKKDSKRVLAKFKRKYLIAVVSQRHESHNWLQKRLEEFELLNFVDLVVTRYDLKEGKPSPEGILFAKEQLQATPVLMIGDAKNDIIAGQRAKIKTIGVATGLTSHTDLVTTGADLVVSSLSEIIDWFETI